MSELSKLEIDILECLDEFEGLTTGKITCEIRNNENRRCASQLIRRRLLLMLEAGLVQLYDDEKPVTWYRTEAGNRVIRGTPE